MANQPLQIVVVPPDYLWRTYEELLTELPVQWGGGPVNRLTDGIRWMAIGIDPKTLVGSATVQSASPAAANQFAPFAPELFSKILGQLPKPVLEMIASFPAMIASGVESQVIGDQIRYTISPSTDSAPMAGEFLGLVERLFRSQMDREVKPLQV